MQCINLRFPYPHLQNRMPREHRHAPATGEFPAAWPQHCCSSLSPVYRTHPGSAVSALALFPSLPGSRIRRGFISLYRASMRFDETTRSKPKRNPGQYQASLKFDWIFGRFDQTDLKPSSLIVLLSAFARFA